MSCSCSSHVPEKARSSAPSMFQVVDQSAQISLPSTPLQVVMSSCHHEDAQASPADSFNVNERANEQVRIRTLRAIQTFILYLWTIILYFFQRKVKPYHFQCGYNVPIRL